MHHQNYHVIINIQDHPVYLWWLVSQTLGNMAWVLCEIYAVPADRWKGTSTKVSLRVGILGRMLETFKKVQIKALPDFRAVEGSWCVS